MSIPAKLSLFRRNNGVYYIGYLQGSQRVWKSTGHRNKADALHFLRTFSIPDPPPNVPASVVLSAFSADFLRFASSTYSAATVELFRRALGDFIRISGNLPLTEIAPRHVDQHKSERLGVVSPTTVNIEMRALHSIFNTAVRWDHISANPFSKVKPPRVVETAPIYLSRDEYCRLMNSIDAVWLKELVEFAVLTGMRRGEIVNLKWKQVDLRRKVVIIQSDPTFKTKTGKLRVVPLADQAVALLSGKAMAVVSDYVFTFNGLPFKGDHVIRNFRKAVSKAGLSRGLNYHSLRHTHASWLVQAGVSIYQVSKILGHSSVEVTQRHYASLEASELHGAVNKISLDAVPGRVLESPDPTS